MEEKIAFGKAKGEFWGNLLFIFNHLEKNKIIHFERNIKTIEMNLMHLLLCLFCTYKVSIISISIFHLKISINCSLLIFNIRHIHSIFLPSNHPHYFPSNSMSIYKIIIIERRVKEDDCESKILVLN